MLPKRCSYCKRIRGIMAAIRAARVPFHEIAKLLGEVYPGLKVAKSMIINLCHDTGMMMQGAADRIMEKIRESPCVNIDETYSNHDGDDAYTWGMRAGEYAA